MSTLQTVSRLIHEITDGELELEGAVSAETRFSEDLELESIELVSLMEKLQEEYGRDLNFAEWLADLELAEIVNLTVGDLVEFIDRCHTPK